MTAEMQHLANDPNFVVQFAIGDPIPNLVPQPKDSGIRMSGAYFDKTKRYVMKKAHMSREDVRIFDVETGHVVMVSHHPGKNPYEKLDPLGLGNSDAQHAVAGGEWESATDVTSRHHSMPSFKIRPKSLSRHGRQFIKSISGQGTNSVIMNIAKKSKLSTQSMRPHFEVGRGEDGTEEYVIVADMMERTFTIKNNKDEIVAQVAKTTKAMIQTAVFGSGSESTIDIAPGVDCSTILAIVYGLGQVGCHFIKDAVGNFALDPLKDSLIGGAINTAGLGGLASSYTKVSNQGQKIAKMGKFLNDTYK
ncbi:hypothetical protein ACHAW5_006663 [Stephanodiscus triporus]|uniref:Uncharacterized protein n=1 Tax=Stephanodiscus triporus TaxID=2934178 RepID=A0ABD3N6J2_9STRA